MKRIALAAALGLTLAPCLNAQAAPTPPTVEQLAAYPAMSGFTVSPDGRHLAALEARGEDRVILVWDTAALDKPPTVIGTKKMKFQSVSFIKDDLLAVTLWQPYDLRFDGVVKTFISKLYVTDLEGKNWHEPMPTGATQSKSEEMEQALSSPQVLDALPNDPDHILVVNAVGMNAGDIYKVDLRTFKAERIQRSEARTAGYVTDYAGNIRARLRSDIDGNGAFVAAEFRDPATNAWTEHFRSYVKNRDQVEVVGFADDPNIAFIRSNEGRDKSVIYEYDIAARKKKDVLFAHKFFEASGVVVNRIASTGMKPGEVLGVTYEGPRGDEVEWFSPELAALDKGLRSALNVTSVPTRFVDPATGDAASVDYASDVDMHILGRSRDMKTVLVSVSGASRPPETYIFKDGRLSLLAKAYPDIDPAVLGTTRLVYYKARDGLDIPAFLTTPDTALCGAGPYRTVVHPHGGPWARDEMGFDASMWVPLMASRCMAVLRPQYRGSQGWGRKLWMAGDAQWGGKMQDDKDDGARWLIDQKIAQPGHIAMFGFSYGGYASMAAAVRPNGLYKCAIAGAGVSDIRRIWSKFYTNPFFRQAQAPTVDGLSPLDQADRIQIPIMVYHGDRDQTVPIEQSQWFVSKAKAAGKSVEYHELADYAHGPAWTRATFAQQLHLIDDYLAKGCGTGGL